MKRSIWVHQWDQCSEQSPQDYADTLLPRGITTVYLKALDGTSWMGDFYSHPLAPTDPIQFAQLVVDFAAVGLELIPWVVPRFKGSEVLAHLTAADAADGKLVVDWEYQYDRFWTGTDAEANAYFNRLRKAVLDGQWVAIAPDPRQPGRDYPGAMIAELSAYLPQAYWTDFKQPAISVLDQALASTGHLGPFEPILPYNGTQADVQVALEWCVAKACQSVSLWRLGTANAAQLDAFAQRVAGEDMPDTDPRDALIQSLRTTVSVMGGDVADSLANTGAVLHKVATAKRMKRADVGGSAGNVDAVVEQLRKLRSDSEAA